MEAGFDIIFLAKFRVNVYFSMKSFALKTEILLIQYIFFFEKRKSTFIS